MRLIDADALQREYMQFHDGKRIVLVDVAPTIEPERKKGKWIEGRDERFVKCSECGLESTKNDLMGIALFGEKEPHFCPNCGADMRGEK